MLQKKDLAKEFSLVVQQEIKNHNDQLLASNMAIEGFKQTIEELTNKIDRLKSGFESDISKFAIAISVLEEELKTKINNFHKQNNDQHKLNSKKLSDFSKNLESRESYFLDIQGFNDFKKQVDQWAANIERAFSLQQENHALKIIDASKVSQKHIEESNKEIRKLIDEEKLINEKQNSFFDIMAVNFDGIKQEIEKLKKRSFLIEKNIENLYTQIERSKGKQ